jgi:hypothetical protein
MGIFAPAVTKYLPFMPGPREQVRLEEIILRRWQAGGIKKEGKN